MRFDAALVLRVGAFTVFMLTLPLLLVGIQAAQSDRFGRGPLLILTAPWTNPEADIAAAGGWVVGPRRAFFAVLGTSDDPDFQQKISSFGYWTARNDRIAQLICGVPA